MSHRIRWHWKRKYFKDMKIDLRRQLNPHIAILGQTGTGKSNACKKLILELAGKGINLLIFDAHNEYVGMAGMLNADAYDAAYNSLNAFDVDGDSGKEKAGDVAEMLRRILRLGYRQYNELYKALAYTYDICQWLGKRPSLKQLLFSIKIFKKNAMRSELSILTALETRLSLLNTGRATRDIDLNEVLRRNSIFTLSRLHTTESQALFIESFLRKIYQRMLLSEKSSMPRLYIVIEEAERLAESKAFSRIVAEGRKYGIGIIAISQRAKALDREIRSNAELLIIFYQREPEELNYISNLVAGGNEYERFTEVKKAIRNMGKGTAIVLHSRDEPSIVRFEMIKAPQKDLGFEISCMAREAISKSELYAQLHMTNFSKEETDVRILQMLKEGELFSYDVQAGKYTGTWYIVSPRNSAEHDIMLHIISSHLIGNGIRNRIYDSAYMPDIVAFADGQKIAIEYETGKKNFEETEHMLSARKGKYSKIVVVVKDEHLEHYLRIDGIAAMSASDFLERN